MSKTLSPAIISAIKDVNAAKLALRHARERLQFELPDDWWDDIAYNGRQAKVPEVVYVALREPA